jgi:RNA polymerase sigma factor (sigma-70 family)
MRPAPTTDETGDDDATLLERGRHGELLARHLGDVRTHVAIRLWRRHHDEYLDEIVQRAVERLVRELRAGKRYGVPYGVVVRKVSEWAVKDWIAEYTQARARDGGDLDISGGAAPTAPDAFGEVEVTVAFEETLARLSPDDREAARLAWIEGMPPAAIARRLGCTRNAVDQRLHRIRVHLRKALLP